jgi:outer membrane lipoprotein-sorting protein
MKTQLKSLAAFLLCLGVVPAWAQMGGPGAGGPHFGGSMAKLFGDNSSFSSSLEMQVPAGDKSMTMPGKMFFDQGKSRFEMDMLQAKGDALPPGAAAQLKSLGMASIVALSNQEKKLAYLVYPELQVYVEMPIPNPDDSKPASDFTIETTELGKETVDSHPVVKTKAVVSDDKGVKHDYTIWKATDLKGFPIKIETSEKGQTIIMLFKDVKLAKPDANLFTPPAGYKKYDNIQTMMQEQVMKRMGGGMGAPPKAQ